LIIAVATERTPKLDALSAAMEHISKQFNSSDWSIVSRKTASGVSETPITMEEIVIGALNRINSLKALFDRQNKEADFYVGMEGGFHQMNLNGRIMTFIQGWVAVSDGKTTEFGSSPNLSIPDKLAQSVYSNNESLAVAIDRFSGLSNVRNKQGVFGVLTNDLLTRELSFKSALLAAFAPFYNRTTYEKK